MARAVRNGRQRRDTGVSAAGGRDETKRAGGASSAREEELPLASRQHPDTPRPVTLLQQRGIEAEVLIPLIRRLEAELGEERAHQIAAETIAEIARQQGQHVREALGRDDLEG